MRERINRLARGMIENGVPALVIKPEAVEASVPPGQVISGEILVSSGNNLHIKGLVYSDNERVKVLKGSFGGLRNHISYEINVSDAEQGDEIKGSFFLVTNGGEREIPYHLTVQSGHGEETIASLKTARDFANLAKRNLELALRMFEYQDFTQAPFMQDARIRTIYEGLKGRTGRRNLLEEFLVALRVKETVVLSADCREPRVYEAGQSPIKDMIDIAASGWGYVSAVIQTDVPFIELGMRNITDQDFLNGRCQIPYVIRTESLHQGKNYGRIRIVSQRQEFLLEIQVDAVSEGSMKNRSRKERMDKSSLFRYLDLRLDYETGVYNNELLLNKMTDEVETLRTQFPQDERVRLLQAELLLLGDREENAALLLEEVKEEIFKRRQEQVEFYCYYEYLSLLLKTSPQPKDPLIRYIKKLLWEDGDTSPYLFLMLLELDNSLRQNPLELYQTLEVMCRNGKNSPFLYVEACRLAESHPDLLCRLGDFELQFLYLGARRGMVSKELALKTARFMLEVRHFHRLMEHLAKRLYETYPETEILEAVCSLLIKGDRRDRDAFSWYEKALKSRINLTRLYEYFLYSLPENYGSLLPKEVLLYFSYEKDLDNVSRARLYSNILMYMNPSAELYQSYTRNMEQFAMEQLFAHRIDSRLAVVYEHMIYKDMIDSRVAKVLPEVLKSCRIQCDDARMKYVIVRYEELDQEKAYLLENQSAYVPVFSKHIVLLFQDAYGSRYLDVPHRRIPVMDKPEFLKQCYKVYPEHPMLKLGACCRILEEGVKNNEDAALLEEVMSRMTLNPVFESRILEAVTDYYCRMAQNGKEEQGGFHCTCLLQMDVSALKQKQRSLVCETLIGQNYIQEAYDLISRYGSSGISEESLSKLCARMILKRLFDEDELLLILSYRSFKAGKADSVILDYLCEHYNGTVGQMYEILIQSEKAHVETYDLKERLLCQMLFTGCCEQVDSVFELYMEQKHTSESIIRAYFTEKSIQYFLEEKQAGQKVFDYLERSVAAAPDLEKIPTIYVLALTRYFSGCDTLSREEQVLCRKMTMLLLEEGLIFPYTRDLSRHIPVPEDILDKAMVEYRGSRDTYPELKIRILPQETDFHTEEISRVYQGIYVKEKVLFEGETMEYRIYDGAEGQRFLAKEGSVACDHKLEGRENSRFACLNKMGAAIEEKDEKKLFLAMEDYLKKSAALGLLFPVKSPKGDV